MTDELQLIINFSKYDFCSLRHGHGVGGIKIAKKKKNADVFFECPRFVKEVLNRRTDGHVFSIYINEEICKYGDTEMIQVRRIVGIY